MNVHHVFRIWVAPLALCGWVSSAAVAETLQDRIKPVGSTCMEGQPCAAAVVAKASGPRTPEEIFNGKCTMCHGTGLMGAPKFGDAAAWGPRVADRKLEGLYTNAIKGFNAMPPKGTCGDCSDDEIKSTVKYIVDKAK